MVCNGCAGWIDPVREYEAGTIRCPDCGHTEPRRFLPLFIVTGPSGVGKTTVIEELWRLLPDFEIFETDIIWDSGGDWQSVKCSWLRIADSLAQRGRPTILCGTMNPDEIDQCESRAAFPRIHYLALECEDAVLIERLRARPAWRGSTDAFIAQSLEYARWYRENAKTRFDPPLEFADTTHATVEETAHRIRDWAVKHWRAEDRR